MAQDIASTIASSIGDLDAEPVLRAVEVVCSLISWSVLASAHKAGYGGLFEYDNYTPLNFLLAVGILQWGFAIGIVAVKKANLLDATTTAKCELYGTVVVCAMIYTGAVAGAASSTQNHDEFGGNDSSTCNPRGAGSSVKKKAQFFCSRVSASVVFAFFATAAAAGSLALILVKQRGADPDARPTDAYNPIGVPPPEPGAYSVPSTHMEGVGSDSIPQTKDAAVDL
ncbi:hypothetical protein CTAYLR_006832 [Chrysophaeum taylorii]|uniref:Casparian strip membrane protein domain-containing protein n=1 Tax=Chrysophaeum taylorii TaxID=2483200 RepID=A0AAD7XMY6_9STRA|nr:hypothetical protein CTAYLR_006832 [Chrysophaeum taylorii]